MKLSSADAQNRTRKCNDIVEIVVVWSHDEDIEVSFNSRSRILRIEHKGWK